MVCRHPGFNHKLTTFVKNKIVGFRVLTTIFRWKNGIAGRNSILILIILFRFLFHEANAGLYFYQKGMFDHASKTGTIAAFCITNQNDTLMGFLPDDNGKTYYYFENGMMRDRTADNADNLWRTSLAFIAYGHPALKEGMLRCTKWAGPDQVQFYRSVEQEKNDVSRDQITMFLAAMKFHGQDVKKYVKAIKYKISDKYKLTPDMKLWMKALAGNRFAKRMFYLVEWPVVKAYQVWNKSNLFKRKFPAYALHLLAWQLYVLEGHSGIKGNLQSMVVSMADDENYLIRLMMDFPVTEDQIKSVEPHTDFIWQRYRNDTKAFLRPMTPEEAEYNALDVDVLKAVWERECGE